MKNHISFNKNYIWIGDMAEEEDDANYKLELFTTKLII